jgi:hypothetical protein
VIQFKEKILKLLGDEKLLERMSRNSQQILRKNFQLNQISNNWKQFIKATINYNKFMFREIIKKELKKKNLILDTWFYQL